MQCTTAKTYQADGTDVAGPYSAMRREIGFSYFTNYTMERQSLQNEILEKFMSLAIPLPLEQPFGDKPHVMTFMMGTPGSGKSTRSQVIAKATEAVVIDPDWFKEQLPEFWKFPARLSSGVVHREAALLAEIAMRCIAGKRLSVVIDTAASNLGWVNEKIKWALDLGYLVELERMVVDRKRGYLRCCSRDRHVPRFVFEQMFESVNHTFFAVFHRFGRVTINHT